jgi:hypothetical protein
VAARNRSLYDSGTVFVLSLRHRVRDFDSWKRVFDERLDARLKGKVTSHRLTRSTTDPQEVEVVMEFASRADAEAYRDYMEQPQTREALARAGVEEHAPMWIGEQLEVASWPMDHPEPRPNATSEAPERPQTRLRAIPGGNDGSPGLRVEVEVRRAEARAEGLRERQLRAVVQLLLRAAALQAEARKAA